ncbi:hypothetical protein CFOL_v3_17488 [Cephalotus follicularis]|uniref:Reverse transcriptase RNase H-like domain-containing protein n=1 Tax=Cephalotus follicularis TaxID=3775 RepID=A0A1Q3C158_CEPFO|nr:hypothetical protein CFOL_v3_17488 [Cephalotus follicularis]
MNDNFNPFSSFSNLYIDDILIFSNSIKQELFITLIHISILFAEKFPNIITDKKQLQRFLGILNYILNLQDLCTPLYQGLRNKNTQSIKQIKIYEIPCLYLVSPLAFKIVETNTSDIGYGGNLKQLVQYARGTWNNAQKNYVIIKKEILVIVLCIQKIQTPYNAFSVIYLKNNLILTKDMSKIFQDCRKLYLLFEVNQIHYQSLSPTEIENRNLTHRLLQGNETLKTHLALLCAFKKFLAYQTIEFYLCVHENTLCANHSMHERKIFPKTFICKTIFPFGLQEMESIKGTFSPTEAKKNMSDTLLPTEIKKNMSDTLSPIERKKNMNYTLFLTKMITFCVQTPFTDKLLFNNSNPTHQSPYKKSSFFHSFIEKS